MAKLAWLLLRLLSLPSMRQSPHASLPEVTCRVFEDNVGPLELVNIHKFCPRNKHPAVQLHHFRQHALDKKVLVEKTGTQHQGADTFAKALPRDTFRHLRSEISGWQDIAKECHEHKFMMESTNSHSKLCEFPLHLSQFKQDRRPNLQPKLISLRKLKF